MGSTRRLALAAVAAGLFAAACTTGGGGGTGAAPAPRDDEQVTVTVWSNFADHELRALNKTLDGFHAKHPNITIRSEGSQDDDKITQSIRGGTAPDVAISFSTDLLGQYCSSGAWQDLRPYLDRDKVDLGQIPQAVRDYTEYRGTRCAMPLLADVYGLYYNKEMFAKAGITSPPRTLSELTEVAKRLTVFNPDGSIQVAGFVPTINFYNHRPQMLAPHWNAQWQKPDGGSAMASDPGWKEMFTWLKELTDFYGKDRLASFTAAAGQQYSADNAFQQGRVAMMLDGEYRTAFIAQQTPNLAYGTAPFPVADSRQELYGGGYTTGTIIGIPRGAKNPGAAWELVKYLTTDTDALVELSNGLRNIPTTKAALDSPKLQADDNFRTFMRIFSSPRLATSPSAPNGASYVKFTEDFASRWLGGEVPNLDEGLAALAKQIDDNAALGGK
ncbi:carbohydrate ABC transporter substrate-binding protein, CUT1 family [Streptoalloteichus tenebrarius]|uniref:Probable sugar-binding periplasmic protein n=1 Tax=Streptoalloteichus tenebrarius (strain ATCC 17920 / DSM 40477 / JCM 4838 / CBS 697.72 / NBRC 16177 / NCIMB 11028 / NRRL B-12390 / A12253. 1 / ISP 5477) TaxID=1933 RepID=A0ABT1HZ47_STRSD|nr:ABC transporter substrate-binding protein [Streptoalloteichus tenebrarius]MCP2260630.1 carbohydrate ABC transporter substrate-binding protein, CUT1 family [Streptoalloteichus tenebrarius]BFF01514.1 extracellular solute-binding protein [Streptoalloteichus tenebrarius]